MRGAAAVRRVQPLPDELGARHAGGARGSAAGFGDRVVLDGARRRAADGSHLPAAAGGRAGAGVAVVRRAPFRLGVAGDRRCLGRLAGVRAGGGGHVLDGTPGRGGEALALAGGQHGAAAQQEI
ncbi:unnamed protein product [Rotaria sp. Silwood1]|nr:unnamed protein product [Rotaria sp. Silwood1]